MVGLPFVIIEPALAFDFIERFLAAGYAARGVGGMGGRSVGFQTPPLQFQMGSCGRVFRTSGQLRLDEVFTLVLDDARARYVLIYRPDKTTPGWHKLKVKLVDAKGDVVARRGYFVSEKGERK